MTPGEYWKNFHLGEELSISGMFIYNGLKCFHQMDTLDNVDEIFEFQYNLSVGLERLLKVAVVLLEHDKDTNIEEFEESLITHNHLELVQRIKKHSSLNLSKPHKELRRYSLHE